MLDYAAIQVSLKGWMRTEPATEKELEYAAKIPSGMYEVYSNKLDVALDEARTVFVRTGVSSLLRSGDLVVGLHSAKGDLVTASCGTYIHAAIAQLPVKYIIDLHINGNSNVRVHPGDIFYTNEALVGGLHNPDQIAIMPIFFENELIAWSSAAVHQPETGAIEPGGMPQTATSRHDEGMRLTPIKIAENYEIRDDLMDMMVNFISRAPLMQEIDVRARCTATDKLRHRVQELAQEIGPEHLHGLFRKMIDAAESGARARISSWTDGVYKSVAFVDTTGKDETLLKVALSVHKKGDSIHLDFTGTSPECEGSYNTYGHGVAAFLATYLYPYVFHDLPVSTGTLVPFTFEVPDGSLLNAGPEKSVCNCVYLGRSVISICFDAFTRLLYSTDPARAVAAPSAHSGGGSFKGTNSIGTKVADGFSFTLNTDGQGARHDKDGMNAHGFFYSPWGKTNNLEDFEEHGIFLGLTRRHFDDAHGFGKYRGGVGTQNVNVVLSGPVEVTSRGKGSRIPHDNGVFGGYASTSLPGISIIGSNVIDLLKNGIDFPVSVREMVVDKSISGDYRFERINRSNRTLETGDIWITLSSGGGGFGDPLERDPADVLSDLNKRLISEWTAKNVYHVCIRDGVLDLNETSKLRNAELQSRLSRGVAYDTFSNTWSKQSPPIPVSTF